MSHGFEINTSVHRLMPSSVRKVRPTSAIVKGRDGSAVLIDADIRRIDEVEEALQLTGCAKVSYLIDTHEHFDHTSANFYFAQQGIPSSPAPAASRAMQDEGGPDFARMLKPVPELYERFPGLCLTLPDVRIH